MPETYSKSFERLRRAYVYKDYEYVDGVHYNPYFNKKIAQRIHDIVFANR
jgi:hypothetical protein